MSIGTQIDLMANGLKETAMNEGKVMNIRWPYYIPIVTLLENYIDGFPNPNSMFQAPNLYFLLALYWKEGKF